MTLLDQAIDDSALVLDNGLTSADLTFRHESVGFLLPHRFHVVRSDAHGGFSVPDEPLDSLFAATHSLHVLLNLSQFFRGPIVDNIPLLDKVLAILLRAVHVCRTSHQSEECYECDEVAVVHVQRRLFLSLHAHGLVLFRFAPAFPIFPCGVLPDRVRGIPPVLVERSGCTTAGLPCNICFAVPSCTDSIVCASLDRVGQNDVGGDHESVPLGLDLLRDAAIRAIAPIWVVELD